MFNGLLYTRKLEAVGFSREQAEAHVEMVSEIVEDRLVTKEDFAQFQNRVDQRFTDVQNQTDHRFSEFESKLIQMESRLTIKLGTIVVLSQTALIATFTLVFKLLQ